MVARPVHNLPGMPKIATNLRQQAALCRRLAEIPTSGDRLADRALLDLAETLEHEAAALGGGHAQEKPDLSPTT